MKPNTRVSWTYTHHLNSRSSIDKTNYGTFIALVNHKNKYYGPQLARVKFDRNKKESRVPLSELKTTSR